MKIISLEAGPLATRFYLIHTDASNYAALIDAPLDCTEKAMYHLEKHNLELRIILLTHSHWDHFAGAPKLKELTGAAIAVHTLDEYRLLDPMKHSIVPLDFELSPIKPDVYLQEEMDILFADYSCFQVLSTPGHTEGSVCFVEKNKKVIFTGDTLFKNSVGRYDFPGGNYEDLKNSIKNKILTLPDDFTIYPGHGMKTTIADEKKYNPFIRFELD